MTTATRRECGLLTSPNGPEDSDDVHQIEGTQLGGMPLGVAPRLQSSRVAAGRKAGGVVISISATPA